jgi:hypothetical protein
LHAWPQASTQLEQTPQPHIPSMQVAPAGQVPQLPPQPSSPHCLPVQAGVQETQVPLVQTWGKGQTPHALPQSSVPHLRPVHPQVTQVPSRQDWSRLQHEPPHCCEAAQPAHCPWGLQYSPDEQLPQEPPHPSLPQTLPVQLAVQDWHTPFSQRWPTGHAGLHEPASGR